MMRAVWIVPALVVGLPLLVGSDNVHTPQESTAYVRLVLPLLTFPALDGVPNAGWQPDPNFPLGTALVFAMPHALGLDPVWAGRLLSLTAAGVATGCLAQIGRACGASASATLAGALAIWSIPAFVRSAVVSGEATFAAALALLGVVAALRIGSSAKPTAWFVSGLLAGAAVWFRLDAVLLLPGVLVAALLLGAVARVPWLALGTAVPLGIHCLVSWRWTGDPLSFLHTARLTSETVSGTLPGITTLAGTTLNELGRVGSMFAAGGLALAMRHRSTRAFGLAALLPASGWIAAAAVGVIDVRIARYLVPAFCLLYPVAVWGWDAELRSRSLHPGRFLLALVCLLFALGLPRTHQEAQEARLPAGLSETAAFLATQKEASKLLFDRWSDEYVIEAELLVHRVDNLRTPETGFPNAAPVGDQVRTAGASHVVLSAQGDAFRAWQEARPDGFSPVFTAGQITVWHRARW